MTLLDTKHQQFLTRDHTFDTTPKNLKTTRQYTLLTQDLLFLLIKSKLGSQKHRMFQFSPERTQSHQWDDHNIFWLY